MKKLALISLLAFFVMDLLAVVAKDPVTLEHLRQTEHQLEKDAPAAYLINETSLEYDFSNNVNLIRLKHHIRIKVYQEEGETYGTFSIPLYGDGGSREKISSLKAFTYNEVNGEIEKTKLAKADIFYEETGEKRTTVKFALPKVRSGSVIDVEYEMSSPYIQSIPEFYFQHFIPVDQSKYVMSIPEFFAMAPVSKGNIPLTTDKSRDVSKGYNQEVYTFTTLDVPSIEEDDYVLNVDDYRSSIKYEISSYQPRGGIRKDFSVDWNSVAISLMDHDNVGGRIKHNGDLYDAIMTLAEGTDDEKIEALYGYVTSNFTWNNTYSLYASQSRKGLLKTQTGNVADINILLLNLLRKAGIKADPVATRYRFSGLLNSNYPSLSVLNYFLVRVAYKGEPILIDATSEYVQLGQLPIRAVNINALVLSEKGGAMITVRNPNVNKRRFMAEYTVDMDANMLAGDCKGKLSDFAAVKLRQTLDEKNEEDDEDNQDLESEDDEEDEEIKDVQVENEYIITKAQNLENINMPIGFEAAEKNYKMMTKIGGEIFIDGDLDMGISKNPFTDEVRDYPVFNNYLQDWTNVGKLIIPEGYQLKSLPESVSLSLPDNLGKFRYVSSVKNNVITVQYIFKINRDYFVYNEYPGLRELYNLIITKQQEKIVLTKM